MKNCIHCHIEKPETDFYFNRIIGKLFASCKQCSKEMSRITSQLPRNILARRERDRIRSKAKRLTAKYKELHLLRNYKWNALNKHKTRCHKIVSHAVKTGRLIKTPCADCGSINRVEGHHHDYSKPLEVTWLCNPCHRKRHPALIPKIQV